MSRQGDDTAGRANDGPAARRANVAIVERWTPRPIIGKYPKHMAFIAASKDYRETSARVAVTHQR